MHRLFGAKENVSYTDREGAYLIPFRNGQIGVIQTPKGYFFIGGGLEGGESHLACIERECMEEAGYLAVVQGKLCSAEAFIRHPEIGFFHPIQTYYYGRLTEKVSTPTEKDHVLQWVEYDRQKGHMYQEMQNWALEELFLRILSK